MLFNLECPLNSLSFGHISFGILHELYKRNLSPNLFPIGQPDLSVYDKIGADFHNYVNSCIGKGLRNYKKSQPSLKIWHVNGAQNVISNPSHLLTFNECDNLTDTEVNILNQQTKVFVTSEYSKKIFENSGVTVPVIYVPMGIDTLHYNITNKKYFDDGSIIFNLCGKFEQRKSTEVAIKGWIKKFGNDKRYRLHIYVQNPFFKPDDMNALYAKCFNNTKPPFNVQVYAFQPNDTTFNDCLNCGNIIIDLSKAETISLPSLISVGCLAKHAIIHRNTGMEWANDENAVIINSNGKMPIYDGVFFHQGHQFSQGNCYTFNEEDYDKALDLVVERYNNNPINEAGLKLKEKYSFQNSVDIISREMNL